MIRDYIIFGSSEYDPNIKRKLHHVIPTIIWAATMMYFFCYWVSKLNPSDQSYSCWAPLLSPGHHANSTNTTYYNFGVGGLLVPYGQKPPASYVDIYGHKTNTTGYANMSRKFWSVNVGGAFICIVHLVSTILHFCRPIHKVAKPIQIISHICTFIYLSVATFLFLCPGMHACGNEIVTCGDLNPVTECPDAIKENEVIVEVWLSMA